MNFKRLMFFLHRWLGVITAVLMLMWFVTGLVIVYSSYMYQDRLQQLQHAAPLNVEPGWLGFGRAWTESADARAAAADAEQVGIVEARLLRQSGHPVWLAEDTQGGRHAISARDGRPWRATPEIALAVTTEWLAREGRTDAVLRHVETVEKPSILQGGQGALAPFHRIAVENGTWGEEFLISAKTGEVVHVSSRLGRASYWAGNWLHLFRFVDLFGWGKLRTDFLFWTITLSFIACVTGLLVAWWRWRPGWFGTKTYNDGRVHPYRAFWFRWHFWAGLIGGIVATLWALSGVISSLQTNLFSPANPTRDALQSYYGAGIPDAVRNWEPVAPQIPGAEEVVQLAWSRLGDEAALVAHKGNGERVRVDSAPFSEAGITAAIGRLTQTDATTARQVELLDTYDNYYYLRHRRGAYDRSLPVLRVRLEDAAKTHVYLDPLSGRMLLRNDQGRRQYRWLFSAIHHWDLPVLYKRPLWDAWMLVWLAFGLVLGVSSVVLGVKRLQSTFRRKASSATREQKIPAPVLAIEDQVG
ncbi:MAG: PepSY domain-containing protein [Zoogloeaceae bacterium]|jgi:uncharacterized iron-regulated membrane protein|nr:PepSY domain-containing protein [Zoogloeaceae bacterium]